MKVYIAAQYARKREVRQYSLILRDHGHAVVQTWHLEPHEANVTLAQCGDELLVQYSERDLGELRTCDILIFFAEDQHSQPPRGGRHVEFGYALAHDKRILVVGERENMFHYLPDVEVYPSFSAAIQALTPAAHTPDPSASANER